MPYALAELGYITYDEAELRSTRKYSFDRAEQALIEAMLEYTPACSEAQYRQFAERARGEGRRMPSTQKQIMTALEVDDWDAAKQNVIDGHPEIEWPTEPRRGLRRPYERRRRRT